MNTSNNQQRQQTSTQVRTFFGDNVYLGTKLYNNMFSVSIHTCTGRDQNQRPLWDLGALFSMKYEDGAALAEACKIVVADPLNPKEVHLAIPGNEKVLRFDCADNPATGFTAVLSVTKGNVKSDFPFSYTEIDVSDRTPDGTPVMRKVRIQSQLIAFYRTLSGYLEGINTDRHLDKMTEDYARMQEGRQDHRDNGGNNNGGGGGYNNNRGNWNRNRNGNWNGGGGYRNNNRNGGNYQNNGGRYN